MIEVQQQPLVAVHLYGLLAERYGAEHHFAIRTPREAVRALDANYPMFQADFLQLYDRYCILADGEVRDDDRAADLTFARELHLIPRIEGQSFALVPVLGLIGITGVAATIISTVITVGVMFGLSMLLRPKQPEEKAAPEEKKDESFAFTGPENVTDQGAAVPLIYGRVYCGSVVISAGLSVSDVAIT